MMKNGAILVLGLLLSACATGHQPTYYYNEVLVVNNSRQPLQDVTISVSKTGRNFSCGNIAPLGVCSNRFARRRYERSPLRIAWTFGNSLQQTSEFVLEVPATMDTATPLRGVVEISPKGSLAVYFQQATQIN